MTRLAAIAVSKITALEWLNLSYVKGVCFLPIAFPTVVVVVAAVVDPKMRYIFACFIAHSTKSNRAVGSRGIFTVSLHWTAVIFLKIILP